MIDRVMDGLWSLAIILKIYAYEHVLLFSLP
jgi:hypothetical protein